MKFKEVNCARFKNFKRTNLNAQEVAASLTKMKMGAKFLVHVLYSENKD